MLARTLLAGLQESVNPEPIEENIEEELVEESFGLKYENAFVDEAITQSYWMSEAIESAFEEILHVDKVYHIADIKGEVQAFTENATPEEIGIMLEGIVTGATTRVIDTVDKLISKFSAWFKKIIEELGAIFATGEKFAKKAENIVASKASHSAKYGKYQYSTYKYDFSAGDTLVNNICKRLYTVDKVQPTEAEKAEAKAMPDEADEAQAAADINQQAEETSKDMDKTKSTTESVEVVSDWDRLMSSIMEGLGVEEDEVVETVEPEEVQEEVVSEAVSEEIDDVDMDAALESILADIIAEEEQISMESVEFILESANSSDVVNTICRQVSGGKADNQGELVSHVKSVYRSKRNKKESFTFFEDRPAMEMLQFVKDGKTHLNLLKKNRSAIVSAATDVLKKIREEITKTAGKDDAAYQKLSKKATTLSAFIGLIQAVINAQICTYKEAIAEYTRILKGFVVYKGNSSVSEAVDASAEAPTDVKSEGDAAAAEVDKVSAEGDQKLQDVTPTEEGCGGAKKCATEEGCGGAKKCATEAETEVDPKEAPTEAPAEGGNSDAATAEAPAEGGNGDAEAATTEEPAKESIETFNDDELSLFDASWAYL